MKEVNMPDSGDVGGDVAQVIKRCREIERGWLKDLNAPVASVPPRVARAIMLGRILSRADSHLARLILETMQSARDDDASKLSGSTGDHVLERELATFSARFEWKKLVSDLQDSGANCEDAFWAGYQFHADLMEKLDSTIEARSEEI